MCVLLPTTLCDNEALNSVRNIQQKSRSVCPRPMQPNYGLSIKGLKLKQDIIPVNTIIVYQCHTGEASTARCLANGEWSRGIPPCPDPGNKTCPNLPLFYHGKMNTVKHPAAPNDSPEYPYATKVLYKCDKGYKISGPQVIFCDKLFAWYSVPPHCVKEETGELVSSSQYPKLTVLLTSISIILFFVILTSMILLYRWRQRKLQRKRWQRYFGNYAYRQSKTNITNSNSDQEMKLFKENIAKPAVPVTDL